MNNKDNNMNYKYNNIYKNNNCYSKINSNMRRIYKTKIISLLKQVMKF